MDNTTLTPRKPSWLRVRAPTGENYQRLNSLIRSQRLHTVCSSASCPNIGECWELGTATFMILGRICTRACRFCDVDSSSRPGPVDLDEPKRLAETIRSMGLKHAVITSVTRDDLPDGGASHFVRCLEAIRALSPHTTLEILTPDFSGREEDILTVLRSNPHVFNHNLETVESLTPRIRSGAQYHRSLKVLQFVKANRPEIRTKSGLMLGLGESNEQIQQSLTDLRSHGVEFVTLGQYLRPSSFHHPVKRYASPEEFAELGAYAKALGFLKVESGPLVRSSYHAQAD
ncbi:MAG: lipoyl synthase [Myxococcaceae bacterium]|nr:lipoyl synthase [Myxococcaceae bacterium]